MRGSVSHNLATIVDPRGDDAADARDIDCGEAAGGIEETMEAEIGRDIDPNDLAAIVDPIGGGNDGAGDIDRGVAAADIEEAMAAECIEEIPYDLANIVDPGGSGTA